MQEFSVVIPVYKGAATVRELCERLTKVFTSLGFAFEVVFVEDGGKDDAWSVILECTASNPNVRGIRLTRNFGQHNAILAGLKVAKYEKVIVMDGDLQDVPEEIPKLISAQSPEVDCVLAARTFRKDSYGRRLYSRFFYKLLSAMSGLEFNSQVANFGIYSRKVIDHLLSLDEPGPYLPAWVAWAGFSSRLVPVSHGAREHGKSTYSIKKLLKLALDIGIGFSDRPLQFAAKLGLFFGLAGLLISINYVIQSIIGSVDVLGYASIISSIWLIGGLTVFVISVVGLYLGRTFEVSKRRPLYVVDFDTSKNG